VAVLVGKPVLGQLSVRVLRFPLPILIPPTTSVIIYHRGLV
jgi:hypothetical protein